MLEIEDISWWRDTRGGLSFKGIVMAWRVVEVYMALVDMVLSFWRLQKDYTQLISIKHKFANGAKLIC